MCDPLPVGKKATANGKGQNRQVISKYLMHFFLILLIFGSITRLFDSRPIFYALAYGEEKNAPIEAKSPLFEQNKDLFEESLDQKELSQYELPLKPIDGSNELFAQKIYDIVGETPIKEMVPFISQKDEKVAAFLVGIAKKESSFGLRSPSKDGKTCYNYWGYKGSAGRGTGMGYACFASAQEAVEVVGGRIDVLVDKNRNTPSKMVDTWKCGTSCKGDPGAPGWVATVALYFDKLVGKNV